jgi:hypothetical protein
LGAALKIVFSRFAKLAAQGRCDLAHVGLQPVLDLCRDKSRIVKTEAPRRCAGQEARGTEADLSGATTAALERPRGTRLTPAFLLSQQTIFFCSIVCLSAEKVVAVSHIKYDLLGFHVHDSGCVVASVSGELSPMLAAIQYPAHRRSLPRQYHGPAPVINPSPLGPGTPARLGPFRGIVTTPLAGGEWLFDQHARCSRRRLRRPLHPVRCSQADCVPVRGQSQYSL